MILRSRYQSANASPAQKMIGKSADQTNCNQMQICPKSLQYYQEVSKSEDSGKNEN